MRLSLKEYLKTLDPRGVRGLAERLGVSVQAVGAWWHRGWIPDDRATQIVESCPASVSIDREELSSYTWAGRVAAQQLPVTAVEA